MSYSEAGLRFAGLRLGVVLVEGQLLWQKL